VPFALHLLCLCCRTGTETLQLWDWLAATVEDAAGGDTAVADLTQARQMAAAAAGASSAAALFGEVGIKRKCNTVQLHCLLAG
jgi:hypothetical protein